MKAKRPIPGKIEEHSRGLGVATEADVRQRARELALLDGRKTPNRNDWEEARRELQGYESEGSAEDWEGTTTWSEAVMSHGHKAPTFGPDDEAMIAEELVTDGVDEALHDEMVEERRTHRENDG